MRPFTPLLALLALPFVSAVAKDKHKTFRLRPDPLAPAEIANLGFLPKSIYYAPNTPAEQLHAFYDTTTKTVNATASPDILFLRPTHGTPMYFVLLGNPFADAVPALTIWNNWSIATKTRTENGVPVTREFLAGGTFMACPSGGNYAIYSGPPVTWCSELFEMEVVWDERKPTRKINTALP